MVNDFKEYLKRKKKIKEQSEKVLIDVSGVPFNGDVFKSLRISRPKKHTMSKQQLANILGVSYQEVLRWENSKTDRVPRLENLKNIALYFQIDPLVLLGLAWLKRRDARKGVKGIHKDINPYTDFCKECGKYKGDMSLILNAWERRERGQE